MKKKLTALIVTALMICTAASCGSQGQAKQEPAQTEAPETLILGQKVESSRKYTLYIGLNDKDTFEQKFSTEDALEKANIICAKHSGGYTQFSAHGGWTNDDGTSGHENTIVYEIYDISESDLKAMLDELLKEFNQSSILVEEANTDHIYYSGN